MSLFKVTRCRMCSRIIWPWKDKLWDNNADKHTGYGPVCTKCYSEMLPKRIEELKRICKLLEKLLKKQCEHMDNEYCKKQCEMKFRCDLYPEMPWLDTAKMIAKLHSGE